MNLGELGTNLPRWYARKVFASDNEMRPQKITIFDQKGKKMAKTNQKEKKAKREMTPITRIVTFNVHRALKGYVSWTPHNVEMQKKACGLILFIINNSTESKRLLERFAS